MLELIPVKVVKDKKSIEGGRIIGVNWKTGLPAPWCLGVQVYIYRKRVISLNISLSIQRMAVFTEESPLNYGIAQSAFFWSAGNKVSRIA